MLMHMVDQFSFFCHVSSVQFVFRWEVDLHAGSAGSGDAAADGHEPAAYTVDEDCDSVTGHVPKTHWLRHEHHAAADY